MYYKKWYRAFRLISVSTILSLAASLQAQIDLPAVIPIVQQPGDNLHADFTNMSPISYCYYISQIGHPPIWLAWDGGTNMNRQIYAKKLDPNSQEWSLPHSIGSNSGLNQFPDIENFGDSTLIVWETNTLGNFDIQYSLYNGSEWRSPEFVAADSADERKPVLFSVHHLQNDTLWRQRAILFFEREASLYWTQFDGQAWAQPERFETEADSVRSPDLGANYYGDVLFVVWEDFRSGNWDIYLSWLDFSEPGPANWSSPFRLTEHPADDRLPQIASVTWPPIVVSQPESYSTKANMREPSPFFDLVIDVKWQTNRNGNWEIYGGYFRVFSASPIEKYGEMSISASQAVDVNLCARSMGIEWGCAYYFSRDFRDVVVWQSGDADSADILLARTRWTRYSSYIDTLTWDNTADRMPAISHLTNLPQELDYAAWTAWERWQNQHWEIWGAELITSIVYTDVVEFPSEPPFPFALFQNYPNPFNPTTTIEFSIPQPSFVMLKIYNLLGREVATLANGQYPVGIHKIAWNAENISSGIYLVSIQAGAFRQTRKMVLMSSTTKGM